MEETCVWKHVMDKEDRVTAPGDFIAASCSSGVHLHAQIHLHCFLKSSFLALQLARPPSDLSFEAERMFTRKPQRNKLVVCSQPSVQLQFTQRWEGRGESLPYSLCPVRSGVKMKPEKRPHPPQTITTISQTSDLALKWCQMFFCLLIALWDVWKGQPVLKLTIYPVFSFKGREGVSKKYIKLWSSVGELLRGKKFCRKSSWRLMFLFLCIFLQFHFRVISMISGDFFYFYPQQIYLVFTWLMHDQRSKLDAIQQFQKGKSPENTLILIPIATFEATIELASRESQFRSGEDERSSDWF